MPHLRHNTRYAPQIDEHGMTMYYSIVQRLSVTRDRGGIGIRAGFRILWGNPWEFESPRSHVPPFPTPRQTERRKGGRTEGDFRLQILDCRLQIGLTTEHRGGRAICNLQSAF